jgi:hypothetical protein
MMSSPMRKMMPCATSGEADRDRHAFHERFAGGDRDGG